MSVTVTFPYDIDDEVMITARWLQGTVSGLRLTDCSTQQIRVDYKDGNKRQTGQFLAHELTPWTDEPESEVG